MRKLFVLIAVFGLLCFVSTAWAESLTDLKLGTDLQPLCHSQ